MKIKIQNFDKRYLIPLLAIAMRFASSSTSDISYIILALYAFFGSQQVIQSLFLSWLFSMINPGIAPLSSYSSIGKYAIIFASALSMFSRSNLTKAHRVSSGLSLSTLLLGLFFVLHSSVVSSNVDVSILKSVLWTVTMVSLLAAWEGLDQSAHYQMEKQVFGGLIAIMFLSIPLLFSGLGTLTNGSAFQGILNQPQAFGPTMALLAALFVGRSQIENKPSQWELLMLGLCIFFIFLSGARTAGLGLVLGFIVSIILILLINNNYSKTIFNDLRNRSIGVLFFIIVLLGIIGFPLFTSSLNTYIFSKSAGSTGFEAVSENSRKKLYDKMIINIKEHPLSGIGFGIASDASEMNVEHDSVFGLPTSASIEKGTMPVAVMEELGIPGFILVVVWFGAIIHCAVYSGFTQLLVIITVLMINLGESIFFSVGGLGLLPMILVAWAYTSHNGKFDGKDCYE